MDMLVIGFTAIDRSSASHVEVSRMVHKSETGNKEELVKSVKRMIDSLLRALGEKDANFNATIAEYITGEKRFEISYKADTGKYLTIHELSVKDNKTVYTNVYDDYVNNPQMVGRYAAEYMIHILEAGE